MGLHIGDNKLVIIYLFGLPEDVCNNLKHEVNLIVNIE